MVVACPFPATDVAELVPTSACHVVASLATFYHILAAGALAVVKVILEEIDLVLIAFAFVLFEEALGTENSVAFVTSEGLLVFS